MSSIWETGQEILELRSAYPEKFVAEEDIFQHMLPGDRIFIGTGCGVPQHLVDTMIKYVDSHSNLYENADPLQIWTLGVEPYTHEHFQKHFRHYCFFINQSIREAVNEGQADYTPVFLNQVPSLLRKRYFPVDIVLIQTSLPDHQGFLSLGISVDVMKAVLEKAPLVIAQVNSYMPRVHGETFIHASDVDFFLPFNEPLLEYKPEFPDDIASKIGQYVSRLVQDGDTIQVGFGSISNAILNNLFDKKDLGFHSELLNDGIVALMKRGVINNSRKTLNPGKSVAAFCLGTKDTYDYMHDNPAVELRTIDYTNDIHNIAGLNNMTAINSALEIDLTGQATSDSIGTFFYSGVGGHANFMRGAVLSPGGKAILVLQSTAKNGKVSRIVPCLQSGAGVTLTRGDIQYVVTEYGIAYLHGKNIRERAMSLIAIAHPNFRPWLIEEAKKHSYIYPDQVFIEGEYPEALETYRTTKSGLRIFFRPIKINDEPLIKDFFYSISDKNLYRRFLTVCKNMPHERLQESYLKINYGQDVVILAIIEEENRQMVVGIGEYSVYENLTTAELALVVRDDYQRQGIGGELLSYLTFLAGRQGILGFTGEALTENMPVFNLFAKSGFKIEKQRDGGIYSFLLSL
ncbi:MAG: GNAT family N-acetyltransferase [Syntrophales bacterium]|nr:GNAT family N-acetyltransferase [Syntrophales bacterium]